MASATVKGEHMKLCVTSTDSRLDSKVDQRFGRAPYFIIVDTETMSTESVKNEAITAEQGAGIKAAQTVCNRSADAVLTGFLGPKAFNALVSSKIKIFENVSSDDTVREAVEKFKTGAYKETPADSIKPRRGHH